MEPPHRLHPAVPIHLLSALHQILVSTVPIPPDTANDPPTSRGPSSRSSHAPSPREYRHPPHIPSRRLRHPAHKPPAWHPRIPHPVHLPPRPPAPQQNLPSPLDHSISVVRIRVDHIPALRQQPTGTLNSPRLQPGTPIATNNTLREANHIESRLLQSLPHRLTPLRPRLRPHHIPHAQTETHSHAHQLHTTFHFFSLPHLPHPKPLPRHPNKNSPQNPASAP